MQVSQVQPDSQKQDQHMIMTLERKVQMHSPHTAPPSCMKQASWHGQQGPLPAAFPMSWPQSQLVTEVCLHSAGHTQCMSETTWLEESIAIKGSYCDVSKGGGHVLATDFGHDADQL